MPLSSDAYQLRVSISRKNLNLKMLSTLKDRYGLNIGYSGHEASVSPSLMAVCLGAVSMKDTLL